MKQNNKKIGKGSEYNKWVLVIGQILLGIQWIRMTLAFVGLLVLGRQDIVINQLPIYYLVMIGFLICSGFLHISYRIKLEGAEK